jgi:hypothetical protein
MTRESAFASSLLQSWKTRGNRSGLSSIARAQTRCRLTVNFAVTGTAALGPDYVQTGAATFSSTGGTVLIPAGASTATVTIQPWRIAWWNWTRRWCWH